MHTCHAAGPATSAAEMVRRQVSAVSLPHCLAAWLPAAAAPPPCIPAVPAAERTPTCSWNWHSKHRLDPDPCLSLLKLLTKVQRGCHQMTRAYPGRSGG